MSQIGHQGFHEENNDSKSHGSSDERRHPNRMGRPALNKALFMNNVCSCLDSCSSYIQSLNALCASGTVLAHSLLQVFRDLPPYRDAAEQFVSTWEELSKATAGASSGVKTETLMALQEVLTSLEEDGASAVTSSIAAVGSCLMSYVELQSEFSLACWKSLSQLVQSISADSLFFFPGSDNNRSNLALRSHELINSIRKYYGQVNMTPADKLQQQQHCGNLNPSNNSERQSTPAEWDAGSLNAWIAHQSNASFTDAKETLMQNELEEVLNLLSCQPSKDPVDGGAHSFLHEVLNALPSSGGPPPLPASTVTSTTSDTAIHKNQAALYRKHSMYKGKRTWPRVHEPEPAASAHPFALTSWVWGLAENQQLAASHLHHLDAQSSQNFPWGESGSEMGSKRWSSAQGDNNSSSDEGSSNMSHLDNEVFTLGLSNMVDPITGNTVRQRRHSSNDGVPDMDLQDPLQNKPVEYPLDSHRVGKTSTWPLKQSSPHIDRFNLENLSNYAPPPLGSHLYPPSSTQTPLGQEKETKKYTLFGQIT